MVRPSGASAGCPSQVAGSRGAAGQAAWRGHLPGERRVPGGVVGKDLVEHDGQGAPAGSEAQRVRGGHAAGAARRQPGRGPRPARVQRLRRESGAAGRQSRAARVVQPVHQHRACGGHSGQQLALRRERQGLEIAVPARDGRDRGGAAGRATSQMVTWPLPLARASRCPSRGERDVGVGHRADVGVQHGQQPRLGRAGNIPQGSSAAVGRGQQLAVGRKASPTGHWRSRASVSPARPDGGAGPRSTARLPRRTRTWPRGGRLGHGHGDATLERGQLPQPSGADRH